MKPLVLITGFLGAGKTTLLRRLSALLTSRNIRIDAILNDYVNAQMEAATINDSMAHIVPIESGCACCESLDELMAVCRAALDGNGDLLLIELNGTADPLPVLETFSLLKDKLPFFPRLQVCLIDARQWGERGDLTALEKRQLETAGFWVLSHADRVNEDRIRVVNEGVKSFAPHTLQITASELEGLLVSETSGVSSHIFPEQSSPTNLDHDHKCDSVHKISHRFTGCSLALPPKVGQRSMEQLMAELPSWVLRAKALVKLVEEPGCRWLFERTGSQPLSSPTRVQNVRNVSASLICIGPGLDENWLKSRIKFHFGEF